MEASDNVGVLNRDDAPNPSQMPPLHHIPKQQVEIAQHRERQLFFDMQLGATHMASEKSRLAQSGIQEC
eukprot:9896671-Karenia_brevis.AAC.1